MEINLNGGKMEDLSPKKRGKCPHCQTMVFFERPAENEIDYILSQPQPRNRITVSICPSCQNAIVQLKKLKSIPQGGIEILESYTIWPITSERSSAPKAVPDNIATDFNEACLVLRYSPKASAALARRCLQTVLSDKGNTKSKELSKQIDEVLPNIPSYLANDLDAIRNIGNFGAHEQKSKFSGLILDVEEGEAEWNLDILEELFNFYYVGPLEAEEKRNALNKKLAEAGKPEIKKP